MAGGHDDRRRPGRRSATSFVATLFLLLALTPGTATTTPGTAMATPEAGTNVVLLGDSVTEQAFGYLGGPTRGAPAHLQRWSRVGWTLAAAAGVARTAVTALTTGTVVLAVGSNDAASWDGGWADNDVARWQGILDSTPATTCVAVVLPGWGAPLHGTPWELSLQQMRTDVSRLLDTRRAAGSPTIAVDWLPVVTQHPDYLAADGIHLATKAAATARQTLYWHAVDTCRTLTTS